MKELAKKCRPTEEESVKAIRTGWLPFREEMGLDEGIKKTTDACNSTFDALTIEMRREYEAKLTLAKHEARKQERERIDKIMAEAEDYLMPNSYDPASLTYLIFKEHWNDFWQALKQEGEG